MNVFIFVLIITTFFAILFKEDKRKFIISTALVHIIICGFRSDAIHGDLLAYKRGFDGYAVSGWFSNSIISNGRNTLFYGLNKLIANLTNNNFQVLLFVIACMSIIAISFIIYRYSEFPYLSYLMWNCFGFYIFSFYSIKQAMAMAFIMLASIGIFEKNRKEFYIFTVLAGFTHMPAFVFLPAYELCRARKLRTIVYFYIVLVLVIVLFRNQIVGSMADLYYEGEKFIQVNSFGVGGKSLMMIALLISGVFLCNIKYDRFRYTFILLATASLIQMFSVYDNVFTRLADYYFQFIILYAPFILKQPYTNREDCPYLLFNEASRRLLIFGFICLAFLFYYRVDLSGDNVGTANNIVANFRFFWQ